MELNVSYGQFTVVDIRLIPRTRYYSFFEYIKELRNVASTGHIIAFVIMVLKNRIYVLLRVPWKDLLI